MPTERSLGTEQRVRRSLRSNRWQMRRIVQALRGACLNPDWFVDITEARRSIETWRVHYNTVRPHRSLDFLSPEQSRMAGETGCGKAGRFTFLENSLRFTLSHGHDGGDNSPDSSLSTWINFWWKVTIMNNRQENQLDRRPSTQDLTWLLDLDRNGQLDRDPPYQRRSVWTRKDQQFFLDTIFRNYPSPAIFLHKTFDDSGRATYHVVDGKQRTQTILDFVEDRLRIAKDFGDLRLDGKKWSQLQGERELKQKFWNYQITMEMMDIPESSVVNEVFDRLNRNARKLTRQELRHAKFDGWLITEVEKEAEREEWRTLGVVTTARLKRMLDVQFLSELVLVVLNKEIAGFDQDALDQMYAKYEEPSETLEGFDVEEIRQHLATVKGYLARMEGDGKVVSRLTKGQLGHFYTLWAFVALSEANDLPPSGDIEARYTGFMEKVARLAAEPDLDAFLRQEDAGEYKLALTYLNNSRGANTDLAPRKERLMALRAALLV